MSYWFCSEFYTLSSSAKILKIGQDLTKLQSLMVGRFFVTQCSLPYFLLSKNSTRFSL